MSDSEALNATNNGDIEKESDLKTPPDSLKAKEKPKKDESDASSEEEYEEAPKVGLLEASPIVEGKRRRASVQRLEVATPKVEEDPVESYAEKGKGTRLGELTANYYITRSDCVDLRNLYRLLYYRFGNAKKPFTFKRNLRNFKGWWFDESSDDWRKRLEFLTKLKVAELKKLRFSIGMHRAAPTREQEAENVMHFLISPSGAPYVADKEKTKKQKSLKRKKAQDKSKQSAKSSKRRKYSESEESEISEEEEEEEEEEDYFSRKPGSSAPRRGALKMRAGFMPNMSDSDNENTGRSKDVKKATETKPTTRRARKIKPVKKVIVESDDSDEIGKSKVSRNEDVNNTKPTDAQIIKTINRLLSTFDLNVVSMKGMVTAVCNEYPKANLMERVTFLKEQIKVALDEID